MEYYAEPSTVHSPMTGKFEGPSSRMREVINVSLDRDTLALARTGKRQVLKRRFGLLSVVGFGSSIIITWEGTIVNMGIGLTNGGPAGLVYGMILCWLGTLSVFISIGELSSMYPTAGGQYHWASILAPSSSKRLLSYIAGWVNVAAWIALPTAGSFIAATMMQELISINVQAYEPKNWHATLIMWGLLALAVIINTLLSPLLPFTQILFLTIHVLGFFATLIPLVNIAPKAASASEIFTTFENSGHWSSKGLSFFIGLQGVAAALLGTDGAVHMSEEVHDSSKNVARSMIASVAINGALGFAMLIAFLFCAGDLATLLALGQSQYPFIEILQNGTGSGGATAVLVSLIIIMNFCATVSAVSSGSRMVWSFARDHGLPFWSYLRRVDERHSIPTPAIMVVVTCCALLGLIQIGSSTVLNAVLSLVLEGFYTSYLCVLIPLLYHRVKGNIGDYGEDDDGRDRDDGSGVAPDSPISPSSARAKPYTWGPWHVKGVWGIVNNALAIVFLVVVGFFALFPPDAQTNAVNMNYSVLVLGAIAVGSGVYYLVWARKMYNGPIVEVGANELLSGSVMSMNGVAKE